MKRRNFILNSLLAGGAVIAGQSCKRVITVPESEESQLNRSNENTIIEPARSSVLENRCVGHRSGPAVLQRDCSARGGADLFIERNNHLGGCGSDWVALLSTHGMSKDNQTIQVIHVSVNV
jgi:hypothetical protein